MKRPGAISEETTSFAAARNVPGSGCAREQAEDVLRHRHVRGRVDAVAGDVAEHDRKPPVRQRQVVVDVASDLDPRRRLVDVAQREPGQRRRLRGNSSRCIVSANAFCCPYRRAFSIASAAWPAIASAVSATSPTTGRPGW